MYETLEQLSDSLQNCQLCPLKDSRHIVVVGEGPSDAKIIVIGEAPGKEEDKWGKPFVGQAGKSLNKLLERAGLTREQVYITNVVKCHPEKNRKPATLEIYSCAPFLATQIDLIKPRLIILLGDTALRRFFPNAFVSHMRGRFISGYLGNRFFVSYHPAAALHNPLLKDTIEKDFSFLGIHLKQMGVILT